MPFSIINAPSVSKQCDAAAQLLANQVAEEARGWRSRTTRAGRSACGISGHRTTYGAPFARIGDLVQGATIDLHASYRRYRYTVTGTVIVRPDQIEVVAPTEHPSLTLTACHPPYSARYRIAVQAELVEVRRVSVGGP